jgi:uncharacterized OsmC-like protein
MELEGDTLVIKRISVRYRLALDPGADRSIVDRVLGFHAEHCPVARSIGGCIAITTELDVAAPDPGDG